MNNSLISVFFIVFILLTALTSVAAWKYKTMIKSKLKELYPDKYHSLLISDSFDSNEFEKQKLFNKFLKDKEFKFFKDIDLAKICERHILFGRVSILFSILVLVCAFVLFT
ncbi:hypothetical protein ACL7TT_01530 [Microbulbifer sp. 2304DJ12-6]|uniref:hypothetical protein n=1 Tax=Microbulbifer sp. 2304DJ12-6 TaxID=3233340 RepID=UPI0039AF69E5